MKFSKKYPKAKHNQEPEPSIVYFNRKGNCWNCRNITHFMDIDFEAYLCSEECQKIKINEFMEVLGRSDTSRELFHKKTVNKKIKEKK